MHRIPIADRLAITQHNSCRNRVGRRHYERRESHAWVGIVRRGLRGRAGRHVGRRRARATVEIAARGEHGFPDGGASHAGPRGRDRGDVGAPTADAPHHGRAGGGNLQSTTTAIDPASSTFRMVPSPSIRKAPRLVRTVPGRRLPWASVPGTGRKTAGPTRLS
jgi:hypothetical protein